MKRLIIRISAVLLLVYILLMALLSVNIISRDDKLVVINTNNVIKSYAERIWGYIERNGMDDGFSDWLKKSIFPISYRNCEIALFDSEYNLLGSTNEDWVVNYNKATSEENHYTTEQAFFKLEEYYSESEVREIEELFFADGKPPQKKGDFIQYGFNVSGWANNLDFIPDKISVVKELLLKNTDNGYSSEYIPTEKEFINHNPPQNTSGMEYISSGYMHNGPKYYLNGTKVMEREEEKKERRLLRSIATDKKRLEANISNNYEEQRQLRKKDGIYYAIIPFYGIADKVSGDKCPAYVAGAYKIHTWEESGKSLIFLWISSFIVFLAAGIIIIYGIRNNEKRRKELEENKRYITSSLAHDLKSPLAVISGYAESIKDSVMPEKNTEYGEAIYHHAMDMDSIICSILSLSQLDGGKKIHLIKEDFKLNDAVTEAAALYTDLLNKNNINLSISGDRVLNADRKLIMRVLDNMLINAVNYTPQNGEIIININENRFSIYNSGSNVKEGEETEIWKPFVRSDKARRKSGSGLGLYIAAVILDAHGFKYGCGNIDEGIEFWFELK